MPEYISLEFQGGDPGLVIDWHKQRAMIKTDSAIIEGAVHLETLPDGKNGRAPAMLLTKRGWGDIYLVNFRSGWDEDDYFDLAESIMKKVGIKNP